jgi:integrase
MAHIHKMSDKPRTLLWRAQVRRKGHRTLVKMFKSKAEAERWAEEQERSIRLVGLPHTFDDLKKHTVGVIVRRYLDEITPTKGSRISETTVLNALLRRDIAKKSLAYVKRQDAHAYIAERLQDTWRGKLITPRTVRREINTIQHVFEVAKERWGHENLNNIFRGIAIKGATHRRRRRLEGDELERLQDATKLCRGLNREYVSLAIYLAIETGMRLQEIFNLKWRDINIVDRRITIRKSKTDHITEYEGRIIVMTFLAYTFFTVLALKLEHQFKHDDLIFPMTREAFKQSWADVVKRATIHDLHFHDLRREAGSRFDEAGLTKAEHDLMMGHANRDMTGLYINSHLKIIQEKLDRHWFKGHTFEEVIDQIRNDGMPVEQIVSFDARVKAINRGLTTEQMARSVELAVRAWKAEGGIPDRLTVDVPLPLSDEEKQRLRILGLVRPSPL